MTRRSPRRTQARSALAYALWALAGCAPEASDAPPATVDAGPDSATSETPVDRLADDLAGAPCTADDECAGGRCALRATGATGAESMTYLGYCTRSCTSNLECGGGGLCTRAGASAEPRECRKSCEMQSDCRDGFYCVGAGRISGIRTLGVCRFPEATDRLADDVAGKTCAMDADCPGGRCAETNPVGSSYPGNYCTGRCYDDAECGRGGVCLFAPGTSDPGNCLGRCETDADCVREGYRCWELGAVTRVIRACFPGADPLPDHVAGEPCATDADCDGASCARELPVFGVFDRTVPAPDGYCTGRCAFDADCGSFAQCITTGRRGGICVANCDEERPCRDGYDCLPHMRDNTSTDKICVASEAEAAPDPEVDAGL